MRERITAGNVTSEQISAIMLFARDAQKNYVISKISIKAIDTKGVQVSCLFLREVLCGYDLCFFQKWQRF